MIGTPIILCGLMAMELARWLPFNLCLWVGEKIAGPPQEASICSHMLCSLQIFESAGIGS